MKNPIPNQLHNPDLRFYIIGKNKKLPLQVGWNKANNYMFFEPKLLKHIRFGGNVGIITGVNSLIVIDFDDKAYQNAKARLLPKTFTVRSAGKGLRHMYYYLKGDMIKKIGIDNADKVRVADIQAGRYGAVCPPSKVNRRYYSVVDNSPISEITKTRLAEVFGLDKLKVKKYISHKRYQDKGEPELVRKTLSLFKLLGLERSSRLAFKCPFHESVNGACLTVMPTSHIYCFHCQRYFPDYEEFAIEYFRVVKKK